MARGIAINLNVSVATRRHVQGDGHPPTNQRGGWLENRLVDNAEGPPPLPRSIKQEPALTCGGPTDQITGIETTLKGRTQTPDELLQRCAKGDAHAFEQLYRITSPRLYQLCLQILKQDALAEEILQEAYIKIWNNAGRFDPQRASAWTWLTRIVRNRALDLLRSLKARPEQVEALYEGAEFASPDATPEQDAQMSAATRAVLDCLKGLKEEQKRSILMAYYYGHTHEELAHHFDAPLGTVKAWVRRGLQRLRQCLQ